MSNIKVELLISGNTAGQLGGQLDLHADEPISLILSVADIKDITQRKSSFSKPFILPSTENNDILLSHNYLINNDGYFDPRLKTKCFLLVDSVQVMKGNLQLLKVNIDKFGVPAYEVNIFSDVDDFASRINGLYLDDIDYSDLTHQLSSTNVQASWIGDSSTKQYFYPFIDYNNSWQLSNLSVGNGVPLQEIYPALYRNYYLKRIFSGAGYTYSSTTLDSTESKNLIVPYNGDGNTLPQSFATDRTFLAINNLNSVLTGLYDNYLNIQPFPCQNFFGGPFLQAFNGAMENQLGGLGTQTLPTLNPSTQFEDGNYYNNISYTADTYIANAYSIQRFKFDVSYTVKGIANINDITIGVRFCRSSLGSQNPIGYSNYFYDGVGQSVGNVATTGTLSFITPWLDQPVGYALQPTIPGERFWCEPIIYVQTSSPVSQSTAAGMTPLDIITYTWSNEVSLKLPALGTWDFASLIPKKIKQMDFFAAACSMQNLYVDTDPNNSNNLIIESRNVYYSGGGTNTWILDTAQPIQEKLLSEQQNKIIEFTYKEDKDYLNSNYKDAEKQIYGNYLYNITNEFTQAKKIITNIFSPTPDACGINFSDQELIIPRIFKLDNNNNFAKTDSNIRILQKAMIDLPNYKTFKFYNTGSLKQYPYSGMLNHPYTGTTDISWGQVPYVYYNLTAITPYNLVQNYYADFLEQINDKNGKLVTCYVKLSPADIAKFSFRDTIFIDGITKDGGAYFYVQKVEYVATNNLPSRVELLKVKSVL